MKRVLAAASIVAVISAIAVAQPSTQSQEQQITQAHTEFTQAMVQRDATSWNKRVAGDALLSRVNGCGGASLKVRECPPSA
jgi:hypothetical protein